MKNLDLKFRQDFNEYEGTIVMQNAKTLDLYKQLKGGCESDNSNKANAIMNNPEYFFCAFDTKTFDERKKKLTSRKDGEKILSIGGGMYCSRTGWELFKQAQADNYKRIVEECDAQEVYNYEFNNHECMFDWEGDTAAIRIIKEIFGDDVAKHIARFNKAY